VDKLILASSSPRRIEILNNCHIPFITVNHEFDEESVNIKNHSKLAMVLAEGKAESISNKKEYNDSFVVGVDTVVSVKGQCLGKPADRKQAEYFLQLLSGRTHKVITGISVVNKNKNLNITKNCISKVKISKLDDKFIQYFLDNNLWEGYAGGYAIQGFFSQAVEKIQGSYSNIVGLPVNVLFNILKDIDLKLLW